MVRAHSFLHHCSVCFISGKPFLGLRTALDLCIISVDPLFLCSVTFTVPQKFTCMHYMNDICNKQLHTIFVSYKLFLCLIVPVWFPVFLDIHILSSFKNCILMFMWHVTQIDVSIQWTGKLFREGPCNPISRFPCKWNSVLNRKHLTFIGEKSVWNVSNKSSTVSKVEPGDFLNSSMNWILTLLTTSSRILLIPSWIT